MSAFVTEMDFMWVTIVSVANLEKVRVPFVIVGALVVMNYTVPVSRASADSDLVTNLPRHLGLRK